MTELKQTLATENPIGRWGEAWEMWELLRRQYAEKNPRPTTFNEIVSWEKMRSLTVEHEVMEQIVLQIRTPVI